MNKVVKMSFSSEERKINKFLEKDSLTQEEVKKVRGMIKKLKPSNEEERIRMSWLSEALFLFDVVGP